MDDEKYLEHEKRIGRLEGCTETLTELLRVLKEDVIYRFTRMEASVDKLSEAVDGLKTAVGSKNNLHSKVSAIGAKITIVYTLVASVATGVIVYYLTR